MGIPTSLRSLWRNRRRTLLSLAVIALGSAVSFFVLGFVQNARAQIQVTTVDQFGALQIADPGQWSGSTDPASILISSDVRSLLGEILAEEPSVAGATPELHFSGLLAVGRSTQVVQVTSQAPGNSVLDANRFVESGRGLEAGDAAAALVGRSLADRLDLAPGTAASLTLTTFDGAYNATPVQVAGIYRFTTEQVERQRIYLPLSFAQLLLRTDGVDRIIVQLDDFTEAPRVKSRLERRMADAGIALEVRTWDELSPIYRQLSSYFDLLFGFLTLAVSILVFFIVLQVLTLSFLERTREIGTIRALGTTRGEVLRLFLAESVWLGLIGSAAGIAAGAFLGGGFNAAGIAWRPPGTIEPVQLAVRIGAGTAALPFAAGWVAAVLSSLFPAWRSSRLPIADALRVE